MITPRGVAVIGGGVGLWFASRMIGVPDLHVIAVGLLALPAISLMVVRLQRPSLAAHRRLATRRVFPGTRVQVDLEVRNEGRTSTPTLRLDDRLPAALGGGARAVVGPIAPGGRRTASYTLVPRARGRFQIGPLLVHASDPFDLSRRGIEVPGRQELVVYPEVEELSASRTAPPAAGSGDAAARRLFRAGEEFYTMRPYETGDDLRRIHWPSTARTGELMIRQHEAARQSSVVLVLDTRRRALAAEPRLFERGVSAAASVGWHYLRRGFGLRLVTPDLRPHAFDLDAFMATLAVVGPSRAAQLTPALRAAGALTSAALLVVVTGSPDAEEAAALVRVPGFARLGVLLRTRDAGPDPRGPLLRAGWDVIVLNAEDRLSDRWIEREPAPARASS